MRNLFFMVFSMFFLLASCQTTYQVNLAEKQEWFGGAAGSGGGINYKVYLEKPGKAEVSVDKVWVGDREEGQFVPFRFFNDSSNTTTMKVLPGVKLFRVQFAERIQGKRPPSMENYDEENQQDEAPSNLPDGFEKGAVIYLKDGTGKVIAVAVQEFTRLQPIAYP